MFPRRDYRSAPGFAVSGAFQSGELIEYANRSRAVSFLCGLSRPLSGRCVLFAKIARQTILLSFLFRRPEENFRFSSFLNEFSPDRIKILLALAAVIKSEGKFLEMRWLLLTGTDCNLLLPPRSTSEQSPESSRSVSNSANVRFYRKNKAKPEIIIRICGK